MLQSTYDSESRIDLPCAPADAKSETSITIDMLQRCQDDHARTLERTIGHEVSSRDIHYSYKFDRLQDRTKD